jgi:hypothetical protein
MVKIGLYKQKGMVRCERTKLSKNKHSTTCREIQKFRPVSIDLFPTSKFEPLAVAESKSEVGLQFVSRKELRRKVH